MYIYFNDKFEKQVSDIESLRIAMATFNQGKTRVFDINEKPVYLFKTVMLINGLTNYQIDKAVVIDEYVLRNNSIKLSMHTTSLDSKRWHKNNGTERFVKIECILMRRGTELVTKQINVSKTKFSALPGA